MYEKKIRKLGWLIALCVWVGTVYAQYEVDGGAKKPLLAVDNTRFRTKVYLVYGMENVTISFTSSSTSHQWYRYQTKALEAEPTASTQQGTTSVISNLKEGCGYFVREGDSYANVTYIWIIDYSKYPSDIQSLRISESVDPCEVMRLEGTNGTETLYYYTPTDGVRTTVDRSYEVSYMTQVWRESSLQFFQALVVDTLTGDPFRTSLDPPLYDTEVQLTGDLFARYFGVEKTVTSNFYEVKAIEVHADTLILSDSQSNLIGGGSEVLAPAQIRFTAYANTPVASLFIWQIFKSTEPDKPLVRFTEPEMEYTFDRLGDYTVKLEVSDRSGKCVNTEYTYEISVTETEVKIPNVFTPEGSPGVNDEFRVAYKSVTRFSAWVFNRWGSEIYHWTDPARGWDGKYRGKYVPAGAYYYVIEYTGTDGKTHKKSGDINVVRSSKTEKENTTK